MTWTLPTPVVGGYALEPTDKVIRTDMEVGSPRTRLRSVAELDKVSATWVFTNADMAEFRTWFRTTAAHGSAWFDLKLNLGNGGLETAECKFIGTWKDSPSGRLHTVTAQLEVR